MFDPTIFDNLKVVAEGAVYDLDLQGEIVIMNRTDQIDLATLSRYYAITFRAINQAEDSVHGELRIYAGVDDLAAEILEKADESIGCYIEVVFSTSIDQLEEDCEAIWHVLLEIWGNRPTVTQKVSFDYVPGQAARLVDTIILKFARKIGEAQADDLPVIVDYMVQSIDRLNEIL
ncbi:MAG TPA: hypothetical protein GX497_09730 [Bacillus bacterium]|nr:hypothetical protein [Bacillus sp. (in: firmicutes)]